MAVRGWGGSVATAIGVAAGAGAAQLGLGYGLGIIAWLPSTEGTSDAAWVASLTWAVWIAATSTVAGAICADRLFRRRLTKPASAPADGSVHTTTRPALTVGLWRLALTVASALGGLVTVVLVAVPARTATRAETISPQTVAAGYAIIGVLIGVLVTVWALSSPAVAGNVIATVGWLWLLAIVSVIDGVASGQDVTGAQLGVWQLTSDSDRFWFRDSVYWPGAALALGSALVIGVGAARRPAARVGTAVSGVAGPLLVAVAYLLPAPRLADIQAEQMSTQLVAPYAVIAGLAGSALVAAIAQRRIGTASRRAQTGVVPPATDGTTLPNGDGPGPAPQTRTSPEPGQAGSAGAEPDRPTVVEPTQPAGDKPAQPSEAKPAQSGEVEQPPPASGKSRSTAAKQPRPARARTRAAAGEQARPAEQTRTSASAPAAGEGADQPTGERAEPATARVVVVAPDEPEPEPTGGEAGANPGAAEDGADSASATPSKPKGRFGRRSR